MARLVNVSVTGAQVVSSSVLRPNQDLRLRLRHEEMSVALDAVVVWSKLELECGATRYRAGIHFTARRPSVCQQVVTAALFDGQSASDVELPVPFGSLHEARATAQDTRVL